MILYRVHTKSTGVIPDRDWLKRFSENHTCPGCREIDNEIRNQCVDVWVEDRPDISALNVVDPGINIARKDFLDLFAEEAKKYLKFGRVFTRDGKPIGNFVTFVGERRLPLRGSEKSYFPGFFCQCCGRFPYYPQYPWYVLRKNFFEQPIYESWDLNGLIITEELKVRIEKGRWKGIYITKIPIIDKPRDGVDKDPYEQVKIEVDQ